MFIRCPHCGALTLLPTSSGMEVVVTCTDCKKTFTLRVEDLVPGARVGDHVVVRR